jgi:hypothetical protein
MRAVPVDFRVVRPADPPAACPLVNRRPTGNDRAATPHFIQKKGEACG